jgi:hypothetical protein
MHLQVEAGFKPQNAVHGFAQAFMGPGLELEALVGSCTSNDIYMTVGHVPETIMTGNTADISHIAEFAWLDWVMFRDNVPAYPDDKMTLGQYLGPATDTGSALTSKILKANGQFLCRTTIRPLNDDESCKAQYTKGNAGTSTSPF